MARHLITRPDIIADDDDDDDDDDYGDDDDDDDDDDVCIRELGEPHLITRPDIIAPCPPHPLPPDTRCPNI